MPLTDRRKLAKCGQRPGQLEGIVCAMCPGRLGPVSDKDTASEWLVCIPLLPVGLSFKARPLLFGMEFQWGKVSLGPSSSCLDLLQWLSSLWFGRVVLSSAIFFFFYPQHPISKSCWLWLQNMPRISPFMLLPSSLLLAYTSAFYQSPCFHSCPIQSIFHRVALESFKQNLILSKMYERLPFTQNPLLCFAKAFIIWSLMLSSTCFCLALALNHYVPATLAASDLEHATFTLRVFIFVPLV